MNRVGETSLSSRQERNLREKERRMEWKNLLARLLSLLPSLPFRVSAHETLHQAVIHIKQMEERLGNLNTMKQQLLVQQQQSEAAGSGNYFGGGSSTRQIKTQIRQCGPMLELNLVGGLDSKISMPQIIRAVEDGGVVVVSAHCCTTSNSVIYTIHSQEISGRIGIDTSTVMERLREYMNIIHIQE